MKTCLPFFAAALMLALAGCATRPVSLADSRPVKPGRLLTDDGWYARPVPHGAKVVIIRDFGKLDTLEKVELLVDGRSVAYLRPRERLDLYVYAGDHILGLMSAPGFIDAPEVYRSFSFKAGRTYHFRVGVVGLSLGLRPATQTD